MEDNSSINSLIADQWRCVAAAYRAVWGTPPHKIKTDWGKEQRKEKTEDRPPTVLDALQKVWWKSHASSQASLSSLMGQQLLRKLVAVSNMTQHKACRRHACLQDEKLHDDSHPISQMCLPEKLRTELRQSFSSSFFLPPWGRGCSSGMPRISKVVQLSGLNFPKSRTPIILLFSLNRLFWYI